MGIISELLLDRARENRQRQDRANEAQANVYLEAIRSGRLNEDQLGYANQQIEKLLGTKGQGGGKESKGLFQRFGQIVGAIHKHKQEQEGGQGGMPPPPGQSYGMTGGKPEESPIVPGMQTPQPGLPPPPSMSSIESTAFPAPPALAQEKTTADVTRNKQMAEAGGIKPGTPEYEEVVATGKYPTLRIPSTKTFQAPDGSTFTGFASPDGQIINSDTQAPVPGAIAVTSQMTGPQKLNTDNGGVPTSITRRGKTVTPESPEWDEADQRLWDSGQKAYKEGQANKEKLQTAYGEARAQMFAKYRTVSVMDKETGEPQEVSQWEVVAHPGKYMAAALGQQLKNRATIFDEIDYTKNQLNDAIDKLPDTAFDSSARAQIAYILRADDPRSALDAFMKSGAATTLSPEQVNYVTALASMSESAMSLRSIGGMGAGSDTLRAAIQGMLPDAGTPSKAYARRQMTLFEGEVKQLRRAIPPNKSLGLGGMPPPPGGPPRTADEFKTYLKNKKAAANASPQAAQQ